MGKFKTVKENKDKILNTLINIEKSFDELEKFNLSDYNINNTAIMYIDVVHGFVDIGALSTPRAENILEPIRELDSKTKNYKKVFFKDTHTENSVEFTIYPPHCIDETSESVILSGFDLKNNNTTIIEKNSINGFLGKGFPKWLESNKNIENFIIVGLVTDICVMNFALTLKAYFNEINEQSNLVVPIECVETFDLDITNHDAQLMDMFALYNMQMNGIKLVSYYGER